MVGRQTGRALEKTEDWVGTGFTHSRAQLKTKKRPPISPAWIHPGLVIGGARSRNHKKTRLSVTHVGHISWTGLQYMQN
jgi:hypothetical protein